MGIVAPTREFLCDKTALPTAFADERVVSTRPWRYLERFAPNLKARDLALGGAYVASGSVEDDAPERAAGEQAGLQAGASSA